MDLWQLVYVSARRPELTEAELQLIARRSGASNKAREVTGVLACCGDHIMQLLEGARLDLIDIYELIKADDRHVDIELLLFKQVERRIFPEWGMALVATRDDVELNRARLTALLDGVQESVNTGRSSAEARILLNDFRRQLAPRADLRKRIADAA